MDNKYLYTDFASDCSEVHEWGELLQADISNKELHEMINNNGFKISKRASKILLIRAYYLITHPEIHDIMIYKSDDYHKYKVKAL